MKKLFRINPIIVTVIILFLTTDCKKEKFTSLPVLSTTSISSVADNNAESKSKVVSDGGAGITVRGVCWNIIPNPSVTDQKTTDDKGVGTFISKITGLTAGTVYYLRAYATNAIGTAYSDEITFSTKATLPTLSTTPVTGIGTSSAMSGGNINYDGGGTITARGVCWGTTANPTTSNLRTTDGTGVGVFTSKIEGLTAGTTYHLRAYATNSLGTAYGSDIAFSTSAVLPVITTSPVSAITSATATSGGTITSDGGASITARGICWSATANPTTSDSKTSDGSGTGQFVSSLTGLTAGATYHLRAYAVNSAGTAYGADITFVTSGQVPASVSQQATNLTITGATLNGVVNPNNLSTIVTFEYGLTTNYGLTIAAVQSPITGNSITNVSADITGLTQGTTYHFRVKTVNSLGTVYSGDMSFVTPNFATLNTIIISAITANSATSGGNIITDGGAPVNARGVCWNTTGNPTIADNKSSDGSGTGSYVSLLIGLLPNTTYYLRSYATNSLGTSYGNQITFLTLATLPTLSTASITGITSSTATGGGNITSDGGAAVTARGVCWSTTPNPTAAGTKTLNGSGTGSFASPMSGLLPNTLYYIRAYAVNSIGTSYGSQLSFTTLASFTLPTNGLVAYYPFNGNANDGSTNLNHGTVVGAILTTNRFGTANSAYYFDGVSNYIHITGGIPITNTFTISFWAYSEKSSGYSNILCDGSSSAGGADFLINFRGTSIGIRADKNAPLNYEDSSPPSLTGLDILNKWVHVVWVMDPTSSKIYLNNNLIATINEAGTNEGFHDAISVIGARQVWGSPDYFFLGKLDDIIIYNRVLSDNEINILYNLTSSK
jgi:hypothetical protein